jgi:tetratricopeptide (TPR) repeat protein
VGSDPWWGFEEAMEVAAEGERARLLVEVLGELRSAEPATWEATPAEAAGLEGSIAAELARLGRMPFEEAAHLVARAWELAPAEWASYYLAQAAVRLGAYEEAAGALARIPDGWFESRDLLWREVHCWELAAIAHLGVGQRTEAEVAVERIVGTLAERAEPDDLAPPMDLLTWMRAHPTPSTDHLLEEVAASAARVIEGWGSGSSRFTGA